MKEDGSSGHNTIARSFITASILTLAALWPIGAQTTSPNPPPTSAGPLADPTLIQNLVAAYHILADQGIVDAMGHVSVRHDRNPNRYFMSRAVAPELVTADDIIEFDLDSNPVDAKQRPMYRERFIHGEIYKARPDVKAVVHNHSPSVIPFGVSGIPLRPVFHMAAFVAEGVPVFDIRAAMGMTNMLVENSEAARALAETLGGKPAVLMRGHGVAVTGAVLSTVVGRSVYLEMNAKLQAQAIALSGGKVIYLEPEEARKAVATVEPYARAWELWNRKASVK